MTNTIDLQNISTEEIAKLAKMNLNDLKETMRENRHLGNTNKPLEYLTIAINNNNKIPTDGKDLIIKFIYANLYNNPAHRFYNGRGYGVELRGC